MMKKAMILLIFVSLAAFGQTNDAKIKFKRSYFKFAKPVSEIKEKTIPTDAVLGLDFYQKNFEILYHCPKKLIDDQFKSETIEIWNDPSKAKEFNSNWTHTYIYDSLSRVTEYSYSGCLICSTFPYRTRITYNDQNRPINLQVTPLFGKKELAITEYVLSYDAKGNLIQLKIFENGVLHEEIEKI
jgi:hypothetical protein